MILLFVLILLLLIGLFVLATAFGYTEKNVTMTISKGEFHYCWYGNEKKPTVVCDLLDLDKRQLSEVDNFLEAFANDRVERSYEVLK